MKSVLFTLGFLLTMAGQGVAGEKVKELSKGSVPASHVSVFCISGFKFASAAFCGANGCGITMVQVMGKNNQPVGCK